MDTINVQFQHPVALFLGQGIPSVGLLLRLNVGLGQRQFLPVDQTEVLEAEKIQIESLRGVGSSCSNEEDEPHLTFTHDTR